MLLLLVHACILLLERRLQGVRTTPIRVQYVAWEDPSIPVCILMPIQAAVERLREDAEKAEDAQVAKWEGTLTKVMDLRCEGVTEEDKWKEVTPTQTTIAARTAHKIKLQETHDWKLRCDDFQQLATYEDGG